jgi:hypothetical protein
MLISGGMRARRRRQKNAPKHERERRRKKFFNRLIGRAEWNTFKKFFPTSYPVADA